MEEPPLAKSGAAPPETPPLDAPAPLESDNSETNTEIDADADADAEIELEVEVEPEPEASAERPLASPLPSAAPAPELASPSPSPSPRSRSRPSIDDKSANVETVAVVENVAEKTNGNDSVISTDQITESFNGVEDGEVVDACKVNNNDVIKQKIGGSEKLVSEPVRGITEENGRAEKHRQEKLSPGKIKVSSSSKKQSKESAPAEDNACFKDDNCTSGESENESNASCVDAEMAAKATPVKRGMSDDGPTDRCPTKKLCQELQDTFPKHDSMLTEYISGISCSNDEEINKHTENLIGEIEVLRDLANAKEIEWNHLIHLRKVKEEILLRLLRKKNMLSSEKMPCNLTDFNKDALNKQIFELNKIYVDDKNDEVSRLKQRHAAPISAVQLNSSGLMMVPVNSSIYCQSNINNVSLDNHLNQHMYGAKNILPKPMMMAPNHRMPNYQMADLNGQPNRYNMQKGRQGAIKDVQSIIADHRQKHPEVVPRRGRRMKSLLNPQMSTPRMPIPTTDPNVAELGLLFGGLDTQNAVLSQAGGLPNGMSFKDVLVQFANMTGQQQTNCLGAKLPPPPPYPEVTLHPVGTAASAPSPFSSKVAQQQPNSLLHGILTKSQPRQDGRFSTFSPTLARLLTAPEKNVVGNNCRSVNAANVANNFVQQKACSEITITAVQPAISNSNASSGPSQPEVVQLDDFEETEPEEDSADRPLVIDEGGRADNNSVNRDGGSLELNESEVPECQGCRKREAQFVCAGCANQWYCSRECQVSAWDEHSEVCSG
ncbi:uncharacterized protein LOC143919589 isoform X2 [Arctopsyche grandis]|uniref:uncharacterized protein LOC143919589 isoform X2 n=1 Tax=Arctopsyche grandis TaxID=121162 RepID=UPI00406D9ACC